ncbi:hypothetical protein ACI3KX_19955, partial [Microbacterium sp. ZW CA_36]|uniref:hypothetical protein n=1 Tax=Microbacterium sp. ZW CA_36 TaxID=3378078 RepID=UPI003851AB9F
MVRGAPERSVSEDTSGRCASASRASALRRGIPQQRARLVALGGVERVHTLDDDEGRLAGECAAQGR